MDRYFPDRNYSPQPEATLLSVKHLYPDTFWIAVRHHDDAGVAMPIVELSAIEALHLRNYLTAELGR